MAEKLVIGSKMPSVAVDTVAGGSLDLPGGLSGNYKVILFYRGHW